MIKNKKSYNPDFVIHPGKTLKDELEFLEVTQVELSKRTGLSEKHISQIINGVDPITSDTAIKLEIAINVSAEFWNNLQKNYDLNYARIKSEQRIANEIKEAKKFECYSELVKLGCVEKTNNWRLRTISLLKFFRVNSLSYISNVEPVAFRQNTKQFDQRSLAAWLRCGEIDAAKIKTEEFDRGKIKSIIPKIRKLTLLPENFGEKLKVICASAGIAVVYTPYFKNTKVNGSTRWIGNKAVIQLNTRGAYSDIFWFTFFHELGHICLHGIKEEFIDYRGKVKDEREKEADDFAAEMLIPAASYKELLDLKPLNKHKVQNFAKRSEISIDIVLGRLAHENKIPWKEIAGLRKKLYIKT